jgi:hypothetical protein
VWLVIFQSLEQFSVDRDFFERQKAWYVGIIGGILLKVRVQKFEIWKTEY